MNRGPGLRLPAPLARLVRVKPSPLAPLEVFAPSE
jgi:hypothetical protein